MRAVEGAQVVEPEESAAEEVVALRVLAVQPPGEVHHQLVEDPLEEERVAAAVDLPHGQRGEGVDRRVDVVERPLVGRVAAPLGAGNHSSALHEHAGTSVERRVRRGLRVTRGTRGSPGGDHGYSHLSGIERMSAASKCRTGGVAAGQPLGAASGSRPGRRPASRATE
jgi:hypothetical protein